MPPFRNFDAGHIAALALTVAIPLLLAWLAHRLRSENFIRGVSWSFALLLAVNFTAYFFHHPTHLLPMQLCDWALFATVGALLTRNLYWFEPAYFWGLGGTLQALITPNLDCGFPSFRCLNFFGIHSGIVAGVLFLIFGAGLRPHPISLLRIFLWSEIYLASALTVNKFTGTNYGFLSSKPEGASLLDYFSDQALLYVLEVNLAAVGLFLILYLPFFAFDQMSKLQKRWPGRNLSEGL